MLVETPVFHIHTQGPRLRGDDAAYQLQPPDRRLTGSAGIVPEMPQALSAEAIARIWYEPVLRQKLRESNGPPGEQSLAGERMFA